MDEQTLSPEDALRIAKNLLVNALADYGIEQQVAVKMGSPKEIKKHLRDLKKLCIILLKTIK